MKGERLNLLIFCANIAFLVSAMTVLIWLEKRFEREKDASINGATALFTRELIGGPDDLNVVSDDWERPAERAEFSQYIREIKVAKWVERRGERTEWVVRPFDHLGRGDSLDALKRVPLKDEYGEYGALYFDLDMAALKSVQIAVWTLAILLILSALVLMGRLWSREQVLAQTTVELEEKGQQLIRLERLALAGQLTANIFHDIRKPILNIRHEMDDLTDALGDFAGASKGLRNIREQVDLYFTMLRDLNLERFVRSEDTEAEYVELSKVIDQSCRLVQYERNGVKLEIQADAGTPLVLAPPYRLIQVFSNLALNAYQAMRGEGELRIKIRAGEGGAEVEVSDNGPGIPADRLPHIFTPFFSTKDDTDGVGLGLYITRQIIEELGGAIDVNSKEAIGTAFTVTLPSAAPAQKKSGQPR
jgi:signal transduction histidine kinase